MPSSDYGRKDSARLEKTTWSSSKQLSLYTTISRTILESTEFTFPDRRSKLLAMRKLFWYSMFHLMNKTERTDYVNHIKSVLEPYEKTQQSTIGLGYVLDEKITGNRYFLLNLRFFCIDLSLYRDHYLEAGEASFESYANKYGILPADTFRFRWLLGSSESKLRDDFLSYIKERYGSMNQDLYSYKRIDPITKTFDTILKKMHRFIRKEVRVKLSFIAIFNKYVSLNDLYGDIVIKLLRAYYKKHPCDLDEVSLHKYLNQAVKTNIVNIQKFYSHKKRSSIISEKNEDGSFKKAVNRNITGKDDSESGEHRIDEAVFAVNCDIQEGTSRQTYVELELDSIIQNYGGRDKQTFTILTVLARKSHRRFTAWLRSEGLIEKGENCIDYVSNHSFCQSKRALADYFGVSEYEINRSLRSISKDINKTIQG